MKDIEVNTGYSGTSNERSISWHYPSPLRRLAIVSFSRCVFVFSCVCPSGMASRLPFSKTFFFTVIFVSFMMSRQFWNTASAVEDEKSTESRERWYRLRQQQHFTPFITCPTGMVKSGNKCVCASFLTNIGGKCVWFWNTRKRSLHSPRPYWISLSCYTLSTHIRNVRSLSSKIKNPGKMNGSLKEEKTLLYKCLNNQCE